MFTFQAPRIVYVVGATITLATITGLMIHEVYKTVQDMKRAKGQ